MKIEFDLDFDQFVFLRYHIVTQTSIPDHFFTRMIIDNVEDINYRSGTGWTYVHTNSANDFKWMKTGHHIVYVQYKTDHGDLNKVNDWNTAVFNIRYFKK